MSATLKVTRQGLVGFELRRGTFDVSLDGDTVRSIEWGQTVEGLMQPGRHTLQVRVLARRPYL